MAQACIERQAGTRQWLEALGNSRQESFVPQTQAHGLAERDRKRCPSGKLHTGWVVRGLLEASLAPSPLSLADRCPPWRASWLLGRAETRFLDEGLLLR